MIAGWSSVLDDAPVSLVAASLTRNLLFCKIFFAVSAGVDGAIDPYCLVVMEDKTKLRSRHDGKKNEEPNRAHHCLCFVLICQLIFLPYARSRASTRAACAWFVTSVRKKEKMTR